MIGIRHKNQKAVESLSRDAIGRQFIYEHLEISKQVIIAARPKIIVVCNTLARDFMGFSKDLQKQEGIWMDFDFEFDENLGTHRIANTEIAGTPIFFTSMLTGQRALDKGSFERLIWHIGFVNNKQNTGRS